MPITTLMMLNLVMMPVDGMAASEVRELPVPSMTINLNDVIGDGQLVERRFKVTPGSVIGFVTSRTQIVGMQARKRLPAGKPVPLGALGEPIAVRKGATVTALYGDNGFSIAASLIALQDGTPGDVVSARNAATGVIVHAVVLADGTLSVGVE